MIHAHSHLEFQVQSNKCHNRGRRKYYERSEKESILPKCWSNDWENFWRGWQGNWIQHVGILQEETVLSKAKRYKNLRYVWEEKIGWLRQANFLKTPMLQTPHYPPNSD